VLSCYICVPSEGNQRSSTDNTTDFPQQENDYAPNGKGRSKRYEHLVII